MSKKEKTSSILETIRNKMKKISSVKEEEVESDEEFEYLDTSKKDSKEIAEDIIRESKKDDDLSDLDLDNNNGNIELDEGDEKEGDLDIDLENHEKVDLEDKDDDLDLDLDDEEIDEEKEEVIEDEDLEDKDDDLDLEDEDLEDEDLEDEETELEAKKDDLNLDNIEDDGLDKNLHKDNNIGILSQSTISKTRDSINNLLDSMNSQEPKTVNTFSKEDISNDKTMSSFMKSILEPKLEEWLNKNLPNVVERIVREEIQKIVKK